MNEWNFPAVEGIHVLLKELKFGRHFKGKFLLTKAGKELIAHPARVMSQLVPIFFFRMDHRGSNSRPLGHLSKYHQRRSRSWRNKNKDQRNTLRTACSIGSAPFSTSQSCVRLAGLGCWQKKVKVDVLSIECSRKPSFGDERCDWTMTEI